MRTVLLSVKGFNTAKQRLATSLTAGERSNLARAMLKDVTRAINESELTQRRIVITASSEVRDFVSSVGFEVVDEPEPRGQSAAINQMTEELSPGSSLLLSLPSDLPMLVGKEIDEVFATQEKGSAFIPSRDGTGTNGVLMKPGVRIEMDYGPDSLKRHLDRAAKSELLVSLLKIPGIAFDLDTPCDLADFIDLEPTDTETWKSVRKDSLFLRGRKG